MIGKLLFVVAIVVWLTKENKAVNRRLKDNPDSQWDASSLQALLVGSSIAVVLGLALSFITSTAIFASEWPALLIGVLVLTAGAWVRVKAIRDLREQFTPNVVILSDHKLHIDGIYQYMRHPGYSGALVCYLGMGLMLNNWLSLLAMALLLVPVYLYRINVEEKALIETFGDQYVDYSRRTRRLIPGVY